MRLLLKKATVLVSAQEVRNNIGPAFLARQYGILPLKRWWPGFWLLCPLAVVGLAGARRWGSAGQPLVVYLLAMAVSVLPFFVNARFRAPLLPVLALFAAAGCWDLGQRWRQARLGRSGPLLRRALLLAAVFLLVNVDWYAVGQASQDAPDHTNLAGILAKGYDRVPPHPSLARRHFQVAVQLDPQDVDAHQRFGDFLLLAVQPWLRRADTLRQQQQWRAAVAASDSARADLQTALGLYEQAAALYPRSWRSWTNAGSCRLWLGNASALQASLALAHGDTQRARAHVEEGLELYVAAADDYQMALTINPTYGEARTNLGHLLQMILDLPPLTPAVRVQQKAIGRQSRVDNAPD
jgi:Tfp pilus assembly protein PilF